MKCKYVWTVGIELLVSMNVQWSGSESWIIELSILQYFNSPLIPLFFRHLLHWELGVITLIFMIINLDIDNHK